MAALIRLVVAPATQEQFDQLDELVGRAMMEAGGPPDGLMAHVVFPAGNGFVVEEVWRTEEQGRAYIDGVVRGAVHELGLTAEETRAEPVWSFARP